MQLTRYNPLYELQKMQRDFDKFWDMDLDLSPTLVDSSTMDLYEEEGNLVAEISLPNFKKNEISVTTEKGMLEVKAEHKEKETENKKRRYYRRESSNSYWRRVALPEEADDTKSEAKYDNGVLHITMPMDKKRVEQKSRSVAIK